MVRVLRQAFWPMVGVLILLAAGPVSGSQQPASINDTSNKAVIDRFATTIVKATPAEREPLLAGEPSLVTPGLVNSLIDLGDVAAREERYSAAADIFGTAAAIAATLHDDKGLARAFANMGLLHMRQDQLEDAQQSLEQALTIHGRLDDPEARARILHNIGFVAFNRGRQTDAIGFYRQSLALRTALQDKAGMGSTHNNLGTAYRDQGDYVQAHEHYLESLAIREALGNEANTAFTLNNLGIFYKEQGNYRQALDTYAKSLAKFESQKHKDGIGRVTNNIGAVYQLQGDYDRALPFLERSRQIKEELNDRRGLAIALGNIGRVHLDRGAYDQAAACFDKHRMLFEELGDDSSIAIALLDQANLRVKQRRYAEGLELIERAKTLATQVGRDEIVWEARSTAATLHRALRQPDQARAELEAAIALIENLRTRIAGGEQEQQLYFEGRLAPYQALVDLHVDQRQPGEALVAAERAKARALLDVVGSGRVDIAAVMTAAEKEEETRLNGQLAALNNERFQERMRSEQDAKRIGAIDRRLEQARLDLEAFHTALFTAHPELGRRRGQASRLSIEEVRDLVPDPKTALLEFLVSDQSTILFVVRRPRPGEASDGAGAPVRIATYRVAVSRKDLAARVERFRSMLANLDNRFTRSARELYDLLLAPAAGELRGVDRLVIVPDGPLWELPFQVLRPSDTADLIDGHTIFLAPSLSVLRESTHLRQQTKVVAPGAMTLAMGNPTIGGDRVARVEALMDEKLDLLPEAERQVSALQRVYGKEHARIYIGDEAREERFKADAASARVLHIATHGILNDRNPMYSHLVLAQRPGSTEDGLLEAREIMQLNMTADVAVLSACETARGRIGRGEGMIGLTWALFVAGVPTTVVSQWKVRSDSTADLMIEFHRRLKDQLARPRGRRDVAGALRMAALKVKRDPRYRHPFHWAPFILIGDGY